MTLEHDIIERVAASMYWNRVNPNKGPIYLSVAVASWPDLAEEHRHGLQVWHCKSFWRDAARAAIDEVKKIDPDFGVTTQIRECRLEGSARYADIPK